jgi:cysteine desulfurase
MDQLYFDYNATAPLATSFIEALNDQRIPFANASATHSMGNKARALIEQTSHYLLEELSLKHHKIFYHSGATEGLNTFFNLNHDEVMAYFVSDHPVVHAIAANRRNQGHITLELPIEVNGDFDLEIIVSLLTPYKDRSLFVNFTYVHNETGFINNLEKIAKLKDYIKCKIHVDAAQAIGRFEAWNHFSSLIDMYTFSGHKFGALKGIGFSCYANDLKIRPLIIGAGQQTNLRGGTENFQGIISLKYALKEMDEFINYKILSTRKKQLEEVLSEGLKGKGEVVLADSPRALNTILIKLDVHKGEFAQIIFDLAGIAVSFGSACSSGTSKGSQTMVALGLEKWQHNIIRISYCPKQMSLWGEPTFRTILEKFSSVVAKL